MTPTTKETTMEPTTIASRDTWLAARLALLEREKELTRLRDAISAQRRALPWVRLDKAYAFDTPAGECSLADLFDGRSQLVVKHFMLGPGWAEGCVGCSFECDHFEATLVHLNHHDVTVVAVSRAPLAEIAAFKARMGWTFPWVSSHGGDFNFDFGVSFTEAEVAAGKATYNYREMDPGIEELSGISAFARDAQGAVYHTYSTYARGGEEIIGTYMVLDLTPKGRDETGPGFDLSDWVKHHDRYGAAPAAKASCCRAEDAR